MLLELTTVEARELVQLLDYSRSKAQPCSCELCVLYSILIARLESRLPKDSDEQ